MPVMYSRNGGKVHVQYCKSQMVTCVKGLHKHLFCSVAYTQYN